jgi:hypothetical protein
MRRLIVSALCAGAVAAPIPVALAQTGPEIAGEVAARLAERHLVKAELHREARAAKRSAKRRAAARKAIAAVPAVPVPPQLAAIAQCESGGNPAAVSSNGMYHGKYQFSVATWAAVGGSGLPSRAPEAEQDMRAAMLYARSGPGQWPTCGR